MKNRYLIYTLDAQAIIQEDKYNKSKNEQPFFSLNLSKKESSDFSKVKSCAYHADNALFYQIVSVLSVPMDSKDDSLLKDKILFLDFSELFKSSARHITTAEDFYSPARHDDLLALEKIFDPNGGLEVTFDGKKNTRFVAFDRSSSMTKKSRISFLASDIREKINERLTLGIDFSSIPVDISKYYSYRGLYLSSGYRINPNDVHLDQENIIVIPDADEKVSDESVITVKDAGKDPLEFVQKRMDLCINTFDGEGLISPEFADKINCCLSSDHGIKKTANSFQIRLPFAKGMLHCVDFHDIIKNEFNLDSNKIIIKDLFGIERCLGKAQIIIPKSMFKCAGWLIDACNEDDPMSFYFKSFRKYSHALYISSLDHWLTNTGKVRLNHQFLSTLDLSKQDFLDILKEYENSIDGTERLTKGYDLYDDDVEDLDEDDNDSESFSRSYKSYVETISKAVRLNRGFLCDYKVKETVQSIEKGLENNLALAKPEIRGEQRFLSSDLFAFVIHVLKQSISEVCVSPFLKMTIKSGCFYMPANTQDLEPGRNYAFLRNPHLSRNEQCILRYSSARESLYSKYFSHLKSIVMVPYKSVAPMILSGADFDGDIVKIIFDKRVVNCIKNSCYRIEDKKLIRELPVVVIPSLKATPHIDNGCIPVKTVIDTFSNNIGLISNMAVKYADSEYREATYEVNRCAECTIVTGLEIDAAKNGKHPSNNIKRMKNELFLTSNTFLDFKQDFLRLTKHNRFFSPQVTINNDKKTAEMTTTNRPAIENIQLFDSDYSGSLLSMIPGEYVKYLYDKKTNDTLWEVIPEQLFIFEQDQDWKKNLHKDRIIDVKNIIVSYSAVRALERKVRKYRKRYSDSTFIGYINTLIDIKYDDRSEITYSVNQAIVDVSNCFRKPAEVRKAIKRLTTVKWHFSTQDDLNKHLNSILGVQDCTSVLSDPTRNLLYDFRFKGYMLLYYILQEIQADSEEDIGIEELDDTGERITDNKYYAVLKADLIENDLDKKEPSFCESSRIKKCRNYLSKLFHNDFDTALKYVYACPNNSKRSIFMWNVFEQNEILKNIYTGDNDNAE